MKPELGKVGHTAKRPHITNEETKAGEVACPGSHHDRWQKQNSVPSVLFPLYLVNCVLSWTEE